jgi:ABC-2 type transport system ATP-binding protein
MNIIEAEGLTKSFGKIMAVDHIDLQVQAGMIFGFLGPNGAGKTTTINMLITLMEPTEGRATVAGYDIVKEAGKVRERIGIVFQESLLDNYLTGYENLAVHADLWGMPRSISKKRIEELLDLVELRDRAKDLVIKYSGGMRRRLEIARGLLTDPEILFLDEPTLGLDPATRRHVWEYILRVKERGVSIFLTTHYMDEAEQLCDRIAIIDHGRIIADGTPASLVEGLGGDVVEVRGLEDLQRAQQAIKEQSFVKSVSAGGGALRLTVSHAEEAIPKILRRLEEEGLSIESVNLKRPNLEDVFIELTGRGLREEGAESPLRRNLIMKRLRGLGGGFH